MDFSLIVMWLGFAMAAYSVVGNDVIQTLGTFLNSNENRKWWILWLYAGGILTATLLYSYFVNDGDVSYGRLIGDASKGYSMDNPKYPLPTPFEWHYLLPPLVLLIITRLGIPVSTSFLILTFFLPKGLGDMINKSVMGYLVAFGTALVVYLAITKSLEKRFLNNPLSEKGRRIWVPLQWLSTGILWWNWLVQDFANIYVYLPRELGVTPLLISMVIILGMLAFIFYSRGGAIQGIVRSKTNTADIRSATIIDFIFGAVMFVFKEWNNVPMSTTWVFIGVLAGRELALAWLLDNRLAKHEIKPILKDLGKVLLGLVISIVLVALIKVLTGEDLSTMFSG